MYEVTLKDVETGEDFKFFGRKLAETEVLLKHPARKGMAYLYRTDADRGPANDKPLYVISTETDGGGFEIEKLRDFHRVQKFFEGLLVDGFEDLNNAHPVFAYLWTFLGNAAANDVDLFGPLERLKQFRNKLKRERAAAAEPVAPREIPAEGFFDGPDSPYENPVDNFPTI
jgi:hypothetical protein